MNNNFVTDTMAIVLRLEMRKMSSKIKLIFEEAENNKVRIFIPTMVLAEIGYLSERNRIDTSLQEVKKYCDKNSSINIEAITEEKLYKTFEIDDIPELHDRIIAGTAYSKKLQLITNDPIIKDSKFVSTLW